MKEDKLQFECLQWFRKEYPEEAGMMFHVPNGGRRNKVEAAQMVATGVVAGVPDLIWVLPTGAVVMIEMKTPDTTLSDVQKVWHRKAGERLENRLFVVHSKEQFMELVPAVYDAATNFPTKGWEAAWSTIQKYTAQRVKEAAGEFKKTRV